MEEYRQATEQGHHHKGDQAARRPHMMFSISGRRFGCNLKVGLFDPLVRGVMGDVEGLGWAHSIARQWVSISSTLTHKVYL